MTSIKTRITTLIVTSVLITSILVGGIAILHLTSTNGNIAKTQLHLACLSEKERLEHVMEQLNHSVLVMQDILRSELTDVNQLISDSSYRDAFNTTIETKVSSLVKHSDGIVSFYLRYNPSIMPPDEGFFWIKNTKNNTFTRVENTDLSIYSSEDIEHVGWYYIPMLNKKPTWMPPYFNKNVGIYMISFIIPIYERGIPLGVIGMDMDFEDIIQNMEHLSSIEEAFFLITDSNGIILYSHNAETGTKVQIDEKKFAYTSSPMSNGWNFSIAVPHKTFLKSRDRLLSIMILITLVISLSAVVLTLFFTGKIINPLMELNEAANKIAIGDLNVTIPETFNDEVGLLAKTLQKTVEQLPDYMYKDALTGLKNSASYKRYVSELEERLDQWDLEFAVIVFDINNLKTTNDTHGHETGNILIISAANTICKVFSHSPVFRIGGDEFVAILQGDDFRKFEILTEQFEKEVETVFILSPTTGVKLPVQIAMGSAIYRKSDHKSFHAVFNQADQLMYKNKAELKDKSE